MGKSTISTWAIFNSYVVITKGYIITFKKTWKPKKVALNIIQLLNML